MTGVINHTNTTPIQYPCKNSNSPKISVFGMKIKIELVLILVWSSETIRILNRDQSWPIVETIKIFRFKSINPSSLYTKLDFHRFPFISQTYHTTVFHPKYDLTSLQVYLILFHPKVEVKSDELRVRLILINFAIDGVK